MCIFPSLVCRTLEELTFIHWLFDLALKQFGETSSTNVNTLKQILVFKDVSQR